MGVKPKRPPKTHRYSVTIFIYDTFSRKIIATEVSNFRCKKPEFSDLLINRLAKTISTLKVGQNYIYRTAIVRGNKGPKKRNFNL